MTKVNDEPKNIRRLPHYKGLPVPANIRVKDGVPDFTDIDWDKNFELAWARKCGLCGLDNPGPYAFIGGIRSVTSGTFRDAPMHEACAWFAARTCPHLTGKLQKYRDGGERTPIEYVVISRLYKIRQRFIVADRPRRAYRIDLPTGGETTQMNAIQSLSEGLN